MSDAIVIRPERNADIAAVYRINAAAFAGDGEARLVDSMRASVPGCLSLVAEIERDVVGHIYFTPVEVIDNDRLVGRAIALGPMAVMPAMQRRGIGSMLVRAGLKECIAAGHEMCFVLGHLRFYPRFGFTPAIAHGLTCKWNALEAFMVAELKPGALDGLRGEVRYHAAFDEF